MIGRTYVTFYAFSVRTSTGLNSVTHTLKRFAGTQTAPYLRNLPQIRQKTDINAEEFLLLLFLLLLLLLLLLFSRWARASVKWARVCILKCVLESTKQYTTNRIIQYVIKAIYAFYTYTHMCSCTLYIQLSMHWHKSSIVCARSSRYKHTCIHWLVEKEIVRSRWISPKIRTPFESRRTIKLTIIRHITSYVVVSHLILFYRMFFQNWFVIYHDCSPVTTHDVLWLLDIIFFQKYYTSIQCVLSNFSNKCHVTSTIGNHSVLIHGNFCFWSDFYQKKCSHS